MEKDTVILSLKDYNHLREFKEKTLEGYIFRVQHETFKFISTTLDKYYPREKVFEELLKENEELKEKKLTLEKTIKNYSINEESLIKLHKNTIKDIKKMSIWKFRKWRKQNG